MKLRERIRNAFLSRTQQPQRARSYAAAKISRITADWVLSSMTADKDIRAGIATIRSRARDLEQNNDHVRKYLAMVEANIVGRGFSLFADGELEKKFMAWLDQADASGKLSAAGGERLVARTAARDGEMLVRILRGPTYRDGMALQFLESDYLDHNHNAELEGGARIVMGVEQDAHQRPVAYHIFQRHPGDNGVGTGVGVKRIRVPASEMIHVYRQERPQQARAVSWMASCMGTLRQLGGYLEAEVVAARVASCQMGFYKIPPGDDFQPDGEDGSGALSDMSPGTIERMPTGWEFQQFTPQHPTSQFGDFVKACLRQIAGGLNVAYNNFANDLEGVSYSSIRSGTIEEREQWIVAQEWFARSYLHPLWCAWLDMATTAGTTGLSIADVDRYKTLDRWTGRRWPWVDPESDLAATEKEIALGLAAPSKVSAARGDNYEEIQAQIAADKATRAKYGLPDPAPAATPSKPKGAA